MAQKPKFFPAEALLGRCIEQARTVRGLSRRDLGKRINETEQQIAKYENGGFVPLPIIEAIGDALDAPVQKKLIRRISFLRKLEKEADREQQEELSALYREIFADILDG